MGDDESLATVARSSGGGCSVERHFKKYQGWNVMCIPTVPFSFKTKVGPVFVTQHHQMQCLLPLLFNLLPSSLMLC